MAKKQAVKKPVKKGAAQARGYRHPDSEVLLRPDVGTQAQFKKKKPPATYRYDSSLSPALDWDGQNPTHEQGEALIAEISALAAKVQAATTDAEREKAATAIQAAAEKLRALSRPFFNWAGKAQRWFETAVTAFDRSVDR